MSPEEPDKPIDPIIECKKNRHNWTQEKLPPLDNEAIIFRACEAGCNAYAAPLGFLEAGAAEFAGEIPLILKLNNHHSLLDERDPEPALTGSVKDALRLGCAAVGFTICLGSSACVRMYEQLRGIAEEAKAHGLAVVVWSYPRGSGISKDGETALDVVAYAAQIAAQLGANIVKVKTAQLASRTARSEEIL